MFEVFQLTFGKVGMLLIFMHRTNIRRLFEGRENKLTFKKKESK